MPQVEIASNNKTTGETAIIIDGKRYKYRMDSFNLGKTKAYIKTKNWKKLFSYLKHFRMEDYGKSAPKDH